MLSWYVARFVAQTLHLPDFTFTVDNKAIITLEGKKLLDNISLAERILCATSVTGISRHFF